MTGVPHRAPRSRRCLTGPCLRITSGAERLDNSCSTGRVLVVVSGEQSSLSRGTMGSTYARRPLCIWGLGLGPGIVGKYVSKNCGAHIRKIRLYSEIRDSDASKRQDDVIKCLSPVNFHWQMSSILTITDKSSGTIPVINHFSYHRLGRFTHNDTALAQSRTA